ncbi:STAS domain-containing protein [Planococcus shixiaomingii]|uniref:STAS domain-containing protein n=1 Tax=Planococcus shixiaomingii TaxID=3058393 RepID=UPI00262DB00E|nr:STAS domain-containing protein [Planococcus sp. N022]WKA53054.1 STAS domain-containing protein [Planococcus sp. N022]
MASFTDFSTYININQEAVAREVVSGVRDALQQHIPEWELEQAVKMYVELLAVFGESLKNGNKEVVPNVLINWSKQNAQMQVSAGGNLAEIVVRYPPTREIFTEVFTRISIDLSMPIEDNAFLIKRINAMLDISLNETFFAFERLTDEFKRNSQKELLELSAPIVPITDAVVVIPLIGFIDEYRTKHMMEKVIPKLADMDVRHVITDFSGVMTINLNIAESLYQFGAMLRLMGMHVVSAGLRPDLAQTIVTGGIDMSKIESFATVKQALQSIN